MKVKEEKRGTKANIESSGNLLFVTSLLVPLFTLRNSICSNKFLRRQKRFLLLLFPFLCFLRSCARSEELQLTCRRKIWISIKRYTLTKWQYFAIPYMKIEALRIKQQQQQRQEHQRLHFVHWIWITLRNNIDCKQNQPTLGKQRL